MIESYTTFLVGALAGVVSAPLLLLIAPERLKRRILCFVLHRSRAHRVFDEGYWYSVFYRRSKEGPIREHAHLLHLSRCLGFYHAIVVRGDYHHFQMIGKLSKGQYVTGSWFNDDPFRKYCGAFQFKVHNDGRTITGKWLGWNQAEAVNAGLWTMIKLESDEVSEVHTDAKDNFLGDKAKIDIEIARDRLMRAKLSERESDRSLMWPEV